MRKIGKMDKKRESSKLQIYLQEKYLTVIINKKMKIKHKHVKMSVIDVFKTKNIHYKRFNPVN